MAALYDPTALNPQQREAVEHPGGPLMVFAGAGSGKTRVITARIARLIGEGVAPDRILAVTFTNKAAREMRERVEEMAGDRARDLWMGTFHSTCARLLRMYGSAVGIDRSFVIYDDGDQMSLIRDLIKRADLDEKSFQPRAVLAEISRAKEKLLSPKKYEDQASGYFERTVADLYARYRSALDRANALDFDDLLMKTVRMLEESEQVRERLQEKFLHLLVDEYQDVNYAQYQLAHILSGKHKNITIVGDDDQSIYAWRGADVSLMLRFSSDHPEAQVVKLTQNYRSTKTILKAAYEVVKHNQGRADKELWTENEQGELIEITEAGTEHDEAMMVVDQITSAKRRSERGYGDFAVLYRTNAQSRVMEEAFLAMRVPHVLVGGQRFYDRKEIKDMIAYLRLIYNPDDDASLRRVINEPTRGIGGTTVEKIAAAAAERSASLYSALDNKELRQGLASKPRSGVMVFRNIIEEGRKLAEQTPAVTPILNMVMEKSGYVRELRQSRSDEAVSRLENLQELINVTTEYDQSEEGTLAGFLENVALISDIDTLRGEGEAVTLMTLHSAKGLEFPCVFMVGMEEGVFPHSRSLTDDTQLEEERRLCYVGMTRAQRELHMTHARRRTLYGQPNFNPRSRFLDDIPYSLTDQADAGPSMATVRQERVGSYTVRDAEPARAPEWKPPFQIGDKVTHRKFGTGVVISCSPLKNDAEVTVAFPGEAGVKKVVQSLAKLEAV